MEKYLISLLELNNRVIVPDLGAFILRQKEPRELVFNDLLAFDDGMLTDRIIQEENLSKSDAKKRIREYVEKARRILEKGDVFTITNLGSLKMDASSRIEFLGPDEEGKSPAPEPAGAEAVTEAKTEKPETEPEVREAEPEETKPEPEVTEAEPEETKPEPEEPELATEQADTEPPEAEIKSDEPEIEAAASETADDAQETAESDETPEETGKVIPDQVVLSETADAGDFELTDGDTGIEVDASKDGDALKPDAEDPPFQIEEETEPEIKASGEIPDSDSDETGTEPEPTEPEPSEPEQASPEEAEPVTGFDQGIKPERPVELETAIAEEPVRPEPETEKTVEKPPVYRFQTPEPPEPPPVESRKRRRPWPWIISTFAVLIIVLAAAWFFFPEQVDRLLKQEAAEDIESRESGPADPGSMEGRAESEEVPLEETPADVAEPGEPEISGVSEAGIGETETEEESSLSGVSGTTGEKQYYVVAGCFADIRNAEQYSRLLRDQGYNASIFGKHKGLHAVCFSSHPTRQAAQNELRQIQGSYDPEAWLLYY